MFRHSNIKAKQTMDNTSLNRNFNNSLNSKHSKGKKIGDTKILVQPSKGGKTALSQVNLSNQKGSTQKKSAMSKYQPNYKYRDSSNP